MTAPEDRRLAVLVTGISAAGKTTVARLLAQRFERGAHVDGDLIYGMAVRGWVHMTPDPSPEAVELLRFRYRAAASLADAFFGVGFTAVHSDIVLGDDLAAYPAWRTTRPLAVVVLAPDPSAVAGRERARGTSAYEGWDGRAGSLDAAVREFHDMVVNGPSIGLRVDSSSQTAEQTVDEILRRIDEALVR